MALSGIRTTFIKKKTSTTYLEMRVILRKSTWTTRTSECPSGRDLYRRFPCDMTNEEVEGKVLTVHEGVHGVSDDLRHHVGINVTVVFVVERCSGQHHTDKIFFGKK